jgi:acyl-CoA reductase-like NAD-dependent aldehyde dehydrogenase
MRSIGRENKAMSTKDTATSKRWTAAELRKLSPAERDAILESAAALAEEEYRKDSELTAFEAFGKDGLYGESSSTETR